MPAKFVKSLKTEYIIIEGDELILEVETDGEPPPVIAWYFDDQNLLPNQFIEISSKQNNHTLRISETVLDDEGVYKCVASNAHSKVSVETEVLVDEKIESDDKELPETIMDVVVPDLVVPAPNILAHLKDRECFSGDEARFDIQVSRANDVKWFLNREPVVETSRFKFISSKEDDFLFTFD